MEGQCRRTIGLIDRCCGLPKQLEGRERPLRQAIARSPALHESLQSKLTSVERCRRRRIPSPPASVRLARRTADRVPNSVGAALERCQSLKLKLAEVHQSCDDHWPPETLVTASASAVTISSFFTLLGRSGSAGNSSPAAPPDSASRRPPHGSTAKHLKADAERVL